jgi:hypothetical protein
MPAKSQSQRELLNARFGHAWVKRHHFDNKGKLPKHVTSEAVMRKFRKDDKCQLCGSEKHPTKDCPKLDHEGYRHTESLANRIVDLILDEG